MRAASPSLRDLPSASLRRISLCRGRDGWERIGNCDRGKTEHGTYGYRLNYTIIPKKGKKGKNPAAASDDEFANVRGKFANTLPTNLSI